MKKGNWGINLSQDNVKKKSKKGLKITIGVLSISTLLTVGVPFASYFNLGVANASKLDTYTKNLTTLEQKLQTASASKDKTTIQTQITQLKADAKNEGVDVNALQKAVDQQVQSTSIYSATHFYVGYGFQTSSYEFTEPSSTFILGADKKDGMMNINVTKQATYTISDPSIVKLEQCVGDCMMITPLKSGSATITATFQGIKKTLTLTVPKETAHLSQLSIGMRPNGYMRDDLLTKFPFDSQEKVSTSNATWSSTNNNVAKVVDLGNGAKAIFAVGTGVASIKAVYNGTTYTTDVVVSGTPLDQSTSNQTKTEALQNVSDLPKQTVAPTPVSTPTNDSTTTVKSPSNSGTSTTAKAPSSGSTSVDIQTQLKQLKDSQDKMTKDETTLQDNINKETEKTNKLVSLFQSFSSALKNAGF